MLDFGIPAITIDLTLEEVLRAFFTLPDFDPSALSVQHHTALKALLPGAMQSHRLIDIIDGLPILTMPENFVRLGFQRRGQDQGE